MAQKSTEKAFCIVEIVDQSPHTDQRSNYKMPLLYWTLGMLFLSLSLQLTGHNAFS